MTDVVCFHNPDEENGWLSNWFVSPFLLDGIEFSMAEQYMMYRKAMMFGDRKTAEKIMNEKSAAAIKQLGRQAAGYDETVWNGCRQIVVYQGLLAKFLQNGSLKDKLIGTGTAVLAECAVHDRIWGIGLSMWDAKRFDMTAWNGQNLLGFALMQVRERIRLENE